MIFESRKYNCLYLILVGKTQYPNICLFMKSFKRGWFQGINVFKNIKCDNQFIAQEMFLARKALNLITVLPRMGLTTLPRLQFSQFFDKQDEQQLSNAFHSQHRKQFLHYKLTDHWKKPLERKARRKSRKLELAATKIAPTNDLEKLVLHNYALGIQYPPKSQEIFAVIQVDGFQYKVLQDALIILDTKPNHKINEIIVFNQVPLIGTTTYTLVGRPFIGAAHVQAKIESISDSRKIIVFKKKRRKTYKRSFGSRISLTQCRITKIVHELKEEVLSKAIPIQ